MCGAHARLYRSNIVRNAPEFHRVMVEVRDGEGRASVTVARLADRSRIQEVAALGFNPQSGERLAGPRAKLQNFEIAVPVGKATLMMRVPEESDVRGGIKKTFEGLCRRENIFVFVLKRSVHQHDSVRAERSLRKRREPLEAFLRQLRARPVHSSFGDRIKIFRGHQSCNSFVMIPANGMRGNGTDFGSHLCRVGTVADDISKTDSGFPPTFSGVKSRFQGCHVGVKIAENEDPHPLCPTSATEYR